MDYSRKIESEGGGAGGENMEVPGACWKQHVEIPGGLIKKEV